VPLPILTKTLLDLGVLRPANGGYRMVKGVTEVSVPDTSQGIIMARLDRLGENGKRTLARPTASATGCCPPPRA